MRRAIGTIMTLLSCCIFLFLEGCSYPPNDQSSGQLPDQPSSQKIDIEIDDPANELEDIDVIPPAEQAPLPPLPPPPPEPLPDPWFEPGNAGGGSQGALKPARTGNEDEEFDGPDGVCDNGHQEVLANNNGCPYDLYGSTAGEGDSYLYGFYLDQNGAGHEIGEIQQSGHYIDSVSAIDFGPDGQLYGVGKDSGTSVFFTIHCTTAKATIIGNTGLGNANVSDIDFDSLGRLFAYVVTSGHANDEFGIIDPDTGIYTSVSMSGILSDSGNGLGSTPFPDDMLYQAGDSLIHTLNKTTGAVANGSALVFPVNDGPRINAMDADPFTNIMYVSINDGSGHFVGTLNINNGNVAFLNAMPPEAPDRLDGLTVNRRYEECDPSAATPVLPVGTSCTDDCMFIETQCDDLIDNDQDGKVDCEDPDCAYRSCNDEDGCTYDDTCVPGAPVNGSKPPIDEYRCEGLPVDCNDGNECSTESCTSVSDSEYKCNYTLDTSKLTFGSCTPNGNLCPNSDDDLACDQQFGENCSYRNEDGTCDEENLIDKCIIGHCTYIELGGEPTYVEFTCEAAEKTQVLVEEGGCNDSNDCTADECEHEEDGRCDYGLLDGVPCGEHNVCTVGQVCNQGTCEDGQDTVAGGEECILDSDCPGSFCDIGLCAFVSCDDGNFCTESFCDGNGTCSQSFPVNEDSSCSTGNECDPGLCTSGVCVSQGLDDNLCPLTDTLCSMQVCTEDGCVATNMDGPTPCAVPNAANCDGIVQCDEGVSTSECVPLVPEECLPE